MSALGLVSRALPVHTARRNCTGDEGGPFEFGNQVLISSYQFRRTRSPSSITNCSSGWRSSIECRRSTPFGHMSRKAP